MKRMTLLILTFCSLVIWAHLSFGAEDLDWRPEKLEYEVKFGFVKVGNASMETLQKEEVRGRQALHARLSINAGALGYRINDVLESWIDTHTLESLIFRKQQAEGSRNSNRIFNIYPERDSYREQGQDEVPSVSSPLDDVSMIYYARTIPFSVGQVIEINRYFIPDRNPVVLRVLRREAIEVPAGEFNTVVISPTIKTQGMFSENGHAELWFTDDARRILVKMKSVLPIGTLYLNLK